MSGGDVALLVWLVGGVALGLVAANMALKEPHTTGSPGLDAFLVFVAAVALAPIAAGVAVVAGLAWCGAWLLPAFRARKRASRADRRQAAEEGRRAEVDRLHAQLDLPPVDWGGRT